MKSLLGMQCMLKHRFVHAIRLWDDQCGGPRLTQLLALALDVARGMAFIHDNKVT